MKVLLILFIVVFQVNSFSQTYLVKVKNNSTLLEKKQVFKKNKNNVRLLNNEQNELLNELNKYYKVNQEDLDKLNSEYEIIPNYKYKIEIDETPKDKLFSSQWELKAVKALEAWKYSTGENIIIGLIDTGIDFEHEDLVNSLWINELEDINNNGTFEAWSSTEERDGMFGDLDGIDQDGNGYYDDVIGYDMVDQENTNFGDWSTPDPIPYDEGEHGTIVAGVMVASANDIGIRGLAYNAKVMTIRAFDGAGEAESDDIATAIVYASLNGAKVLNFSFGEPYSSPILRDAIKFAYSMGVVMVASSGNNGWFRPHFPSDYPEVISVGGSNSDNDIYGFSNYGSFIDLVAPGSQVLTTEAFFNDYDKSSGTSLSAPFVSAASALLLSNNNDLSPSQVRSILQTTAFDLGDLKWDYRFGAGLLDAAAAVKNPNNANIEIVFPRFDDLFIKSIKSFDLIGSTTIPLFDKWEVYIGEGYFPDNITFEDEDAIAEDLGINPADVYFLPIEQKLKYKWKLIDSSNLSIKNSKITNIDISNLKDTTYTIRLLIKTKNNSSIERRTKIRVANSIQKLKFETFKVADAYDKGSKVYYFASKTNLDCDMKVEAVNKLTNDTSYFSNTNYGGNFHYIKMHDLKEGSYNIKATAISRYRDTSVVILTSNIIIDKIDKNSFFKQDYSFRRSYQLNKIANFTSDKPQFFVNDLTNLDIDKTLMYEFDGTEFNIIDSSNSTYIPIDYADFDGDGKLDLMTSASNETVVFLNTNSILKNQVYKSNPEFIEWGEGSFDIDNDGKNEILCTNLNFYTIKKFINNTFQTIDTLFPTFEITNVGFERGGLVDDFDNDGNAEFVLASRFGTLHIYEYKNGKVNESNTILDQNSLSRQFMSKYTFPDGTKGFLSLNYGDSELFNERNSGQTIWSVRLFKSTGDNKFTEVLTQQFHGVRDGLFGGFPISYKNGITAGNLDQESGDEIVVSVFPNLYIFKLIDNILKPLYHTDDAISNLTMIYDFDGNGTNEIAISNSNGTELFEYKGNEISNLIITDAYNINQSSAYIEWKTNETIDGIEIYEVRGNEVSFVKDIPNANSTTLTQLLPNSFYYYTAVPYKIVNGNNEYGNSLNYSDIIEIHTHNKLQAIQILEQEFNTLKIKFNGKLPKVEIESKYITFNNSDISINPNKILTSFDSTAILIFNDSIPKGDYNIEIKSFRDYYNSPSETSNYDISVNYEIIHEVYLKRLEIQGRSLITLEFSEEVAQGADIASNYILKPSGYVLSVDTIPLESNKVQLNIDRNSKEAIGKNYTIQVLNVYSKDGHPMTNGPGNTLAFTYSANSLDDCFVYPNPISLKNHSTAVISNITQVAQIQIFNLQGNLINTLQERDGNGGVEWDLKDSQGKIVKSGIYLYQVTGIDINGNAYESELFKFAITP